MTTNNRDDFPTDEEFLRICRTDPPFLHIEVSRNLTVNIELKHGFAIAGLLGHAMQKSDEFAYKVMGAAIKYMREKGIDPIQAMQLVNDEYDKLQKKL